jgi:hypothetical protein
MHALNRLQTLVLFFIPEFALFIPGTSVHGCHLGPSLLLQPVEFNLVESVQFTSGLVCLGWNETVVPVNLDL